ncbi:MAG: TIGR02466 family protein [Pseudobdellovibrio sp.]|nr:TIGR02466 family protein [Pseudobdellovibrio sp.]
MIQAFVTQIYNKPLAAPKILRPLSNKLLEDVENLLASDEVGHKWSDKNYVSGYTSYGSVDKLHLVLPNFKKLEQTLEIHLKNYLSSLEYDIKASDLYLSHCWVNVMPEGAQHSAHIHPLSVISGTVYLQLPKGSSPIKFEDPRLGFFMNSPLPKESAKMANKRFLSLKPKEGDVVLFESWLRHEVPQNTTQEPRISVSFNYGWKKD